jgi:hypothetical protein
VEVESLRSRAVGRQLARRIDLRRRMRAEARARR